MEYQHKPQPRAFAKKIWFMFLSLAAGVLCAVGQHLFYSNLDGKPPPDSSFDVWHGVSRQKVNIAIGNALAFCTKAFLAVAIAAAHDQISWKAIKSRPAEIGLIDALFSSRDDWMSAMNTRMWWHMPFPAFLLLLFWVLQLAPLITPSALTITTAWVNTTEAIRVPRADFTSMNFASVTSTFTDIYRVSDRSEWQTTELTYEKPQSSVKKAVQGSLIAHEILSIAAPSVNASWTLDFHGPSVKCSALTEDNKGALRTRIFTQYAEAWGYGALGPWKTYLSWLPEGTDANSSLPYTAVGNNSWTPRLTVAGGEPLSIYVMILPQDSPPDLHHNITTEGIVDYMEETTKVWEMTLQNVSYSARFSYANGAQDIKINKSEPMNNVDYLSGYSSFLVIEDPTYNASMTQIKLNQSAVEKFAYQAVIDAFSSMLLGNVTISTSAVGESTSTTLDMRTNVDMTPLIHAAELANVSQALGLAYSNLGNVAWDGAGVYEEGTTERTLAELAEEMFQNATISLMNEAVLNPNYTSPYAPPNVNVEKWTSQSVYDYSASTLWITYGIAIFFTVVSVLVGTIVVISSQSAYTSQFSTFLRVSQNVHLHETVAPQDKSGRDPLPTYLQRMLVGFPREGEEFGQKGDVKSSREGRGDVNGGGIIQHSDEK
ncbi:hypothetical protein EDB81DRAFT_952453 [Dactylonectria macrodidyma]|uniref:Uncharacterized protein n=1 Tax=Dactylonectria macrodidyma TaxID=307937 RepID=A0A9P9IG10_9HYPO|nr:hypothetical protein EDB81DRAFT_952453 [Dactylonectria macrodidyma]